MMIVVPRPARAVVVFGVVALLAGGFVSPTQAALNWIQPGDAHDGSCTLSFVYDGVGSKNGKVYIGTAAHCVSRVGQEVSTSGFNRFGRVAYIGDDDQTAWDFALIEVKAAYQPYVNPAVKGHPHLPVGYTVPSDTIIGDSIQISGFGMGYGSTTYTQENRVATFQSDNNERYAVSGPIHWGDSGGPLVHLYSGKALGIVSRLCIGACTEQGPTVEGILNKAAASGFPLELRTV